jgi:hypothetical protein
MYYFSISIHGSVLARMYKEKGISCFQVLLPSLANDKLLINYHRNNSTIIASKEKIGPKIYRASEKKKGQGNAVAKKLPKSYSVHGQI